MTSELNKPITNESSESFYMLDPIFTLPLNRKLHTLGVLNSIISQANISGLDHRQKLILYNSALNHDIGYQDNLNKTGRHYVDGFHYVQSIKQFDSILFSIGGSVARLVLHHTYAHLLDDMLGNDTKIFEDNPLTEEEKHLLYMLNEADLTTSSVGKHVSVIERYEDVANRYGKDSTITKHLKHAIDLHLDGYVSHYYPQLKFL